MKDTTGLTKNKLQLVKVKNPFRRYEDREISLVNFESDSLLDLRNNHYPKDIDLVIAINGKPLKEEEIATYQIKGGDSILFIPNIRGDDGGKQVMSALAFIALAVVSYGVGLAVIGASWGAALTGWGLVASMATMMVGGILINTLLPPPTPDLDTMDYGSSVSQTYSWNPRTIQQQGGSVIKSYGLNKLYGNVIATHIENIDNNQYINALIHLGMGPVNRLYDYKINKTYTQEFTGVDVEARYGKLKQQVIRNFNDTKVEYVSGRSVVYGAPITYTTIGNTFDQLELDILLPEGSWGVNQETGGLLPAYVNIMVEVQKQGSSTWTNISESALSYTESYVVGAWSAGQWVTILGSDGFPQSVWEEYEAGTTDQNEKGMYDGKPYSNDSTGKYGSWRWISSYSLWGTVVTAVRSVTTTVSYTNCGYLTQTSPIYKTFKTSPKLPHGTYNIRVTRQSSDYPALTSKLSAVREVYDNDFTYPRSVLVGVRALATDQLSGSFDFSCLCEGSLVRVYDGTSTWSVAYSNNPAWVCYDVLTQPVFIDKWGREEIYALGDKIVPTTLNTRTYICTTAGTSGTTEPTWSTVVGNTNTDGTVVWTCQAASSTADGVYRFDGISPDRIDTDSFYEWSTYCDETVTVPSGGTEKRHTFNGVFDTETPLWESALKICENSSAILVWNGYKLNVVIDKDSDPVQLFSMGNIVQGSFKETFLPLEDRASEIEVDFINAEKDYERDRFIIFNSNINNPTNKVTLQGFGITNPNEVWRNAMHRLKVNEKCIRTIEFDADVDAIACTVGDVIYFQHEVPQWGYGGRVVSASGTNTVVLDQDVTMTAGSTYDFIVRLSDDTVVEKTVVNTANTTNSIQTVATFSTLPSLYDVYAFGVSGSEAKEYRIIDISRSQDLQFHITAVEYDSSIYDNLSGSYTIQQKNSYTMDTSLPTITILGAKERMYLNDTGSLSTEIELSYQKPSNLAYSHSRVYSKDVTNVGNYTYIGEARQSPFISSGFVPATQYVFAMTTVNTNGVEAKLDASPTISFTFSAIPTAVNSPTTIGTITPYPFEDGVTFNWPASTCTWLRGYKVRDQVVAGGTTTTWTAWKEIVDNNYTRELSTTEKASQGKTNATVYIEVKGVDVFDNTSPTAATTTTSVINQKPYVTVGTSAQGGMFTSIADAVTALTSTGGGIFVKDGTHNFAGAIAVPNVPIDIIGESKTGTILQNAPNASLFTFNDTNTNKFSMSNLSVTSTNTQDANGLIYASDGPAGSDFSSIDISCVVVTLQRGSSWGDSFIEYGISSNRNIDYKLYDSEITGGWYVVNTIGGNKAYVTRNLITDSVYGVSVLNLNNECYIRDNIYKNSLLKCAIVSGYPANDGSIHVLSNYMSYIDDTTPNSFGNAITVISCDNGIVDKNVIVCKSSCTTISFTGIAGNLAKITNNEIIVDINTNNATFDCIVSTSDDKTISGNKITFSDTNTTANHNGIRIVGDRNVVSNNNIDGTNNNAKDLGIVLPSGSDYNQVSINSTYRVGTGISDAGTGNDITVGNMDR